MFSMTAIREKSHILLWVLLFFFILGMGVTGLVGGANIIDLLIGSADTNKYVGSINGKPISRSMYETRVSNELTRPRIDNIQTARANVWDRLITRTIHDEK